MRALADEVAAARRLYDLGDAARVEAHYLAEHYQARRVTATVYDRISLLVSASLLADREAYDVLLGDGDENGLARADVLTEEIARMITVHAEYRRSVDSVHRMARP